MYDMLRPGGIGRDGFIALGLQQGFRLKTVEKQTRTTYSTKSNRYGNLLGEMTFTDINQLWTSDITYLFCLEQFFYIVFVMDVYSRRIIGYSLAENMRAENNLAALQMAISTRSMDKYHYQLIHHSDKGTQYASDIYTEKLQKHEIQISMCNEVYENTHIERVNDTIKNQYLNRMTISGKEDLKRKLAQSVRAYNEQRPHQSLNRMSPVDYEKELRKIDKENRTKMNIYTVKTDGKYLTNKQLNLFETL